MTTVRIHEDDEGMRCVYPLAALDEVHTEIDKARRAEQANRAPGGVGWTDMHMIEAPKHGYGVMKLMVSDVAAAVAAHLPKITQFEVGFSPSNPFYRAEGPGTCFGFGNALFLKLEGREGRLEAIWFDVVGPEDNQKAPFVDALRAIDAVAPSIIADWRLLGAGPISNPDFLSSYTDALWRRT